MNLTTIYHYYAISGHNLNGGDGNLSSMQRLYPIIDHKSINIIGVSSIPKSFKNCRFGMKVLYKVLK
jgi:hypothetical protein